MLADRGYDADWFREALEEKGITSCIPGRKSRGKPIKYDKRKYKRRNRIEIMFGRLKDWRRVATRYDRCPTVFFILLGNLPRRSTSKLIAPSRRRVISTLKSR
ncbi:transposase [Gluconobacter roseus NBRC 3990]|nr:transposase [Gluconobacter roseus NBRC 3990]